MGAGAVLAVLGIAGLLVAAGAWAALRRLGAQPALARRLAGPREVRVGDLARAPELPARPVRVTGRVRCREPLQTDDERLVAYHRDVEVAVGTGWRTLERLRETRSFELWDHDGSLTVDPSMAREPLIVIPSVWRGRSIELEEPHRSAAARVTQGTEPAAARSATRSLNVTDHLAVVARAVRSPDGGIRLEPPAGGYLITNLALPDAMRLLGGRDRRAAALTVVAFGVGVAAAVIGLVGASIFLVGSVITG